MHQQWAEAEAQAEAKRLVKAKRQPMILLVLLQVLVLGTGIVGAIDLRRLATPGGTALRWVQSAVFGDCGDYLTYSVADPSVADSRTHDQLCRDLRAATAAARSHSSDIGLRLTSVVKHGTSADAQLVITSPGKSTPVSLDLARVSGHWRVVRNQLTCGSVGCP